MIREELNFRLPICLQRVVCGKRASFGSGGNDQQTKSGEFTTGSRKHKRNFWLIVRHCFKSAFAAAESCFLELDLAIMRQNDEKAGENGFLIPPQPQTQRHKRLPKIRETQHPHLGKTPRQSLTKNPIHTPKKKNRLPIFRRQQKTRVFSANTQRNRNAQRRSWPPNLAKHRL